jgi:hypothetical protein
LGTTDVDEREKLTVAEHSIKTGLCTGTSILGRTSGYRDCVVKEAIEI